MKPYINKKPIITGLLFSAVIWLLFSAAMYAGFKAILKTDQIKERQFHSDCAAFGDRINNHARIDICPSKEESIAILNSERHG